MYRLVQMKGIDKRQVMLSSIFLSENEEEEKERKGKERERARKMRVISMQVLTTMYDVRSFIHYFSSLMILTFLPVLI